jgi:glycosyltransferase involved in cell wall biosynthesis
VPRQQLVEDWLYSYCDMRIYYFNYSVGSGIEATGNEFSKWIPSILEPSDVYFEQKIQDQPSNQIQELISFHPDVIIANEMYLMSIEQMFYYKSFFPETKTIILCQVWEELQTVGENTSDFEKIKNRLYLQTAKQADSIFVLNCKPEWVRYKEPQIEERYLNRYHPVDDDVYKIKVSWWDRPNLFGYFGNIYPLKFSHEFVKKNRIIDMDLYGKREFKQKDMSFPIFNKDLNNNKYMHYKGIVPQEQMPDMLNSYKFFVLPHSGTETFNITLLQAIKCGTIPLVVRKGTWLHWAKDMHLALGDEDRLIQKMIEIKGGFPDLTPYSETISKMAKEKYSYDRLRKEFQDVISSFRNK